MAIIEELSKKAGQHKSLSSVCEELYRAHYIRPDLAYGIVKQVNILHCNIRRLTERSSPAPQRPLAQ